MSKSNTTKTKIKSNISANTVTTAVGVGSALAAAAVGAYWFYGSAKADKHRKVARSWMLKARAEVLEAVETVIEKMGDLDKKTYTQIVEDVLKKYSKVTGVKPEEMKHMSQDMKNTWEHMQKAIKSGMKSGKTAKKAVKNVKKAVKSKTRTAATTKKAA